MSSSQASSRSPGEDSYYTAEEDHHSNAQGSSEASSTTITTPKGSSDSVYATAIQTPTASPGMNKATDQDSFEALRRIEESPEERRERNLSHVTAAPSFTHRAEASTHLEKQRALDMQQARMEEPDIDMVEYGISALMPEKEESVPGKLEILRSLSAKQNLVAMRNKRCDSVYSRCFFHNKKAF